MTQRLNYTTWDAANLGTGIGLTQSNTVIQVETTNTLSQYTRALYGKSSLQFRAELLVWGSASLTGKTSIGFVNASADTAKPVGGDANGYGYRLAEGELWTSNADVAPSGGLPIAKKGDIIGLELDATDSDNPVASWLVNGNLIATQTLAAGTWYIAASIAVPSGTDTLMCFINGGQRAFDYPSTAIGWYDIPADLPAVRVATGDFITSADDALPNIPYDGAIDGDSLAISRGLTFWTDGGTSSRSSTMTLTLLNPNGDYDWLAQNDISGLQVYVVRTDPSGSFDSATNVAKANLKSAVIKDDGSIILTMADAISDLDVPLQNALIHPDAEEAAANKPVPIVIGAVRSMSPVLVNANDLVYLLSDRAVIGLGYVRDKGDPWDPNAVPPDYVISDDRKSMTVDDGVAPQGKVTADLSSIGGGTEPTTADDAWDQDGMPFVDNGSGYPTGFNITERNFGDNPSNVTMPYPGVVQLHSGLTVAGIDRGTWITGRFYRYKITFSCLSYGQGDNYSTLQLMTRGDYGSGVKWTRVQGGFGFVDKSPELGGYGGTGPHTVEGVVQGPGPGLFGGPNPPPIGLIVAGSSGTWHVMDVQFLLIPDVYEPAAIWPATLEIAMRGILQDRFELDASEWSSADAQAIDQATGYSGIGWNANETITVRNAIDEILPSYGSASWQDRDGDIRFTQLVAPEDAVDSGTPTIEQSEFLDDLIVSVDTAPGLTTRAGYKKNWTILNESDFVTDFIDVPRAVRRALSNTHQGFVASSVPLPNIYRHAISADPLDTCLDAQEDAQAEINRIVTIYSKQRYFYRSQIEDNGTIDVGDIVYIKYNRYGLDAGKAVQVREIIERPVDNKLTVTFWG